MDAPEANIHQATAILIDVNRLDAHSFQIEAGNEPYVTCQLGAFSLKSAVGICADEPEGAIYFSSLMKLPFNYDQDRIITFTLNDRKEGYEIGRYTFDLTPFERQKPTRCVRVKLRGARKTDFGFLEMKVRLSSLEITRPVTLKYTPIPQQLAKTAEMDDFVEDYDVDTFHVKSISISLFFLQDLPSYYDGCFVKASLGHFSGTGGPFQLQKQADESNKVNIDNKWTFVYDGARYLRITFLSKRDKESFETLCEVQIDIRTFVTARHNVVIAPCQVKHRKQANTNQCPMGLLHYKLEKGTEPVQFQDCAVSQIREN